MSPPSFFQRLFGSPGGQGRRLPGSVDRQTRKTTELCRALLSERGEASGATLARETLASYEALQGQALAEFFDILAVEFSPEPDEVARAATVYREQPGAESLIRLQEVVEPPRLELFRRINLALGGTAALVEMRRRILRARKQSPHWRGVEADLAHLLSSWFNRGFLRLERIDWRTSALVLEKLIAYEAVHEIQGWRDLRRRLAADRRCFAFFHPALPEDPIIFIEVALTRGLSDRVQPLLDPDSPVFDPARADCAVFYSITNCQEGLRGVSFGNFLIKQVAEDLGREFPRLRTFATLSPMPGFRAWLSGLAASSEEARQAALAPLLGALARPGWWQGEEAAGLEPALVRLGAHYLLHARREDEPADPVARFHLGNGARVERVNWLGDTSSAGLERSAGLMANYVYRLGEVERNHEAYVKERRVVSSARLAGLARESLLGRPGRSPA